ncbi:hypothetical protein [Streptomyces blattellae]|uniref:hypothetical protein n=1 Tax=Streptomyces blattellae TaxID=2569855 RepID=UPI0012B83B2F|nr:hypothetical protein [Streptomyces blattellae]
MAVTPHSDSGGDPVLPFPSRLGLLLWFVVQWILIPVEFVAKLVWLLVAIFGGGHEDDLMRLLNAPARFISPGKLALRLSRNPAKHEASLDREFARLGGEIERQQFGWRTTIYHYVTLASMPDGGRLKGVALHPREFRGTPVSALTRLADKHHLVLDVPTDLRRGVSLRPIHRKIL